MYKILGTMPDCVKNIKLPTYVELCKKCKNCIKQTCVKKSVKTKECKIDKELRKP